MSKGLRIISMSLMARNSAHLGGSHIHQLLSLDVSSFSNSRHTVEFSIVKLKRNLVKLNVLQSLYVLFIDKSGQVSAELILCWKLF